MSADLNLNSNLTHFSELKFFDVASNIIEVYSEPATLL